MKDHPIRLLTAREIDCRISQVKKNGIQLLLYKDARCDMAILDETFGPMNWQRHHTRDNANCIISIYDEDKGCWVDKEDVGTESNTEAQKGLASDSFKRAGVNWGIGRELYTAPFIWIDDSNCNIKQDERNPNRLMCYDRFEVSDIGYNEHREINRLVIINSKTHNVVYEMGKSRPKSESKPKPEPKPQPENEPKSETPMMATEEQKAYIREHASDDDYVDIMQEFGAELENLSYNDGGDSQVRTVREDHHGCGPARWHDHERSGADRQEQDHLQRGLLLRVHEGSEQKAQGGITWKSSTGYGARSPTMTNAATW